MPKAARTMWSGSPTGFCAVPRARRSRPVYILSRGSGVWWRELVQKSQSLQDLCSLGGEAYDEIEIPVTIAVHDRRALFDASVKAFRAHGSTIPGYATESRPPSPDLFRALDTEDDYQRPFAVQIAALLHVAGIDAEGRLGIAGLLNKILGLEYEYWDKALKIGGQSNWQAAVRNGVAQVTLVGAVESAQRAAELIARDPLFSNASDIDGPRVCHKLSLIFPGENDGLAGLEPDLIGEHHVLEVATSDALVDACLGWAGEERERRQHVLRVLNRATRPEHGEKARYAEGHLARLIQTHAAGLGGDLISVAVETPGRLLDLCRALQAQVESLHEPALAAIDAALPPRRRGSIERGEVESIFPRNGSMASMQIPQATSRWGQRSCQRAYHRGGYQAHSPPGRCEPFDAARSRSRTALQPSAGRSRGVACLSNCQSGMSARRDRNRRVPFDRCIRTLQ
jgi:hypothetical protein